MLMSRVRAQLLVLSLMLPYPLSCDVLRHASYSSSLQTHTTVQYVLYIVGICMYTLCTAVMCGVGRSVCHVTFVCLCMLCVD